MQQSSDESYSSPTSSPKKHRRSSSFNGMASLGFGSSDSNISTKSSPIKNDNPLHVSWSKSAIASLCAGMTDCSPESKMIRRKTLDGGEDTSFCAFELIRQLSFGPTQKTKKRANTAETELASSFDSDSYDRNPIAIGLDLELDLDMVIDLKQPHPLRRSPSPLLGLKYLPEEDMFI